MVSEILRVNHVRYHTLCDDVAFHNETIHHLITLWALGASPAAVQAMYDLNKPYQALINYHPASPVGSKTKNPAFFKECIGTLDYFEDSVRFCQDEIAEKGVPAAVNEYLLKGDELTDDILARLHTGFLHQMIHLGIGLEFNQPCLVAGALAAGRMHVAWPRDFFFSVENTFARSLICRPRNSSPISPSTASTHPTSRKAPPKSCIHTCAYILGAAQHPDKVEAIDFVMLHIMTLGIFYPTFMAQDWITPHNKTRLLQWKAWVGDAVMYAGCGCPALYADRITSSTPERPRGG
ncbi:hypothetical protein C8A03DRAFT_38922 [Achaetomium macrosporum]|uniref:Oxidoreductase AflY n=1 Tax=Achaetomium macrosporum TaxID=79813 RepID=A0AAN7H3I0_9PEZI|nr:hypothetical protein C8A03DRAFT_38922 [Achaetomium macrosporum]